MPQSRIEKLITITKKGDKGPKFWIKDESGEFYSGFKEWQGSSTTEWNLLQNGNHGESFEEGQQALIEYSKTAGTDKEGKDVIYKNLKAIYPADTTPKPNRVEKPPISQNNASGSSSSGNDEFGRRLAVHGLVNALVSNTSVYYFNNKREEAGMGISYLVSKAIEIEDEINKQLNPSPLRQAVQKHAPQVTEELPTIEQGEDMNVEGVPF